MYRVGSHGISELWDPGSSDQKGTNVSNLVSHEMILKITGDKSIFRQELKNSSHAWV